MNEKLLDVNDTSVEKLVKRINEIVGEKFSVLDEENDIEKWNTVPKLLLISDESKNRVLSFVEFIDSMFVSLEEKAMYVISLCGLLEFANISLEDYDDGSLFTMADYYQNSSIEEIKNTLPIVGNKELLLAVRKKTLDLDVRKKLLQAIFNRFITDHKNITNQKDISNFIENVIKELEEKDYYDLIK